MAGLVAQLFTNKIKTIGFSQSRRQLVSFKDLFSRKSKPIEEAAAQENDTKERISKEFDADKIESKSLTRVKAYQPPSDVEAIIQSLCQNVYSAKEFKSESYKQLTLSDPTLKFNLLTKCIAKFDHDIPNTKLNELNTIADLVEYFSTEQRDTSSFEDLYRQPDLPKNMHINTEYKRFDPATDTFFGGRDAYPDHDSIVSSLWYSKKYKSVIKKKDYFIK